jgi:hypothetical protein
MFGPQADNARGHSGGADGSVLHTIEYRRWMGFGQGGLVFIGSYT